MNSTQRSYKHPDQIRDRWLLLQVISGKSHRQIAVDLGCSRQNITVKLKRLQPVLDILLNKAVAKMARQRLRALGLESPRRPQPRTPEEIAAVGSPAKVAHTIMRVLGQDKAREVAKRINHSLNCRKYRQRVKERTAAVASVFENFSESDQ